MKKLVLSAIVLGLLAGCANTPVVPAGGLAPATSNVVVKDMGHVGGHTIAVNLYSPVLDDAGYGVLSETAEAPCWALGDLYQYDVTLKDANTGEVLTTFSVLCKTGRSKAVFSHLKPGKKYSITIVAKGNHGGTAPTHVLNANKPSVGYFDLTGVPADQGPRELSAAIQVELDCEGYGYDRTGRIDIIPVARNGERMSNEKESGEGNCYACGDFPVSAGTTFYDSTFDGGTNGDVFNANPHHNPWTNAINGWAWVQRDLPVALPISRIDIAEAKNDPQFGTCTEIYLKLKRPDGSWVVADSLYNQNLSGYSKRLDPPVQAVAFKLELKSPKGWLSARGIQLSADAGVPCPPTPPVATPVPGASPTATPAPGASVAPTPLPPCVFPSPTPLPSLKPTPGPAPTPGECCVAVTGTSNVTVGGNAFNFEINTAANSPSGIGRVNFTDTKATGNPQDDVHAQWTLVKTRCIIENGKLTGGEFDADVDGNGTADITFTLIGDPPGGSGSHVQVRELKADVLTNISVPFADFDTTGPNADMERSTQNVFPDDNCDGVPDPNTFPVG